jgi:excisionase family DNA binding protein
MKDWGTVAQAAQIMKCSKRWVQMLIADGVIEAEEFGYQFRVNLADARSRARKMKSQNGKRSTASRQA